MNTTGELTGETIAATAAKIHAATATPAPQPERLFTLAQIQQAGGFSRSTLFRLRHGGGLRTITIAGLVRVRERDWQAWLNKHTATPEGGAE
jgi:predicted DNA-binding transcriptional regulator AlpA